MITAPKQLTDPAHMAKAVWEYWVSVLRTDRVVNSEEMPDWDDVEDEMKYCFIEALTHEVVKPLKVHLENIEFDSSLDDTFADLAKEKRQIPCYVCGSNPVSEGGKVCPICWYSHMPKR